MTYVLIALLLIASIVGPIVAWKEGHRTGMEKNKRWLDRFYTHLVDQFAHKRNIPDAEEIVQAAYHEARLDRSGVSPKRGLKDIPVVKWTEPRVH